MKRIFTVIICFITLVAFLSSASAINRAPKEDSSDSKKETTKIKEMKKEKKDTETKSRASSLSEKVIRKGESTKRTSLEKSNDSKDQPKSSEERYDYFKDKNNNGIDDRLEKEVKTKSVPKPKITKEKTTVPAEKKPTPITPVEKPSKKVVGREEPKKEKKEVKPKEAEGKKQSKRR